MKFKIFTLLLVSMSLMFCSKSDEESIEGKWILVKITGGFAGVNCDYVEGDIYWTFENGTLTVENNLSQGDICNSISGTSVNPYSISESEGEMYLEIDGSEVGQLTLTDDQMALDQNKFSTGEGADGFIMTLIED